MRPPVERNRHSLQSAAPDVLNAVRINISTNVGTTLLAYIEQNVRLRVMLERLLGEGKQLLPTIVIMETLQGVDKTAGVTVTRQREAETNMG